MKLDALGAYVRENWGAPFVLAFMVLLIVAAGDLSFGSSDAANSTAIVAFYALVIGVALQIASYLKYGEGKDHTPEAVRQPQPPLTRITRTNEFLAIGVVVMLTLTAGAGISYGLLNYTAPPPYLPGVQPLSASVSYVTNLKEPDGSTVISFGITAYGGTGSLSFSALWSDGFKQNSTTGAFTRTFVNQTLPTSADVTVLSGNGEIFFVTANLTASK